MPQQDYGAAQPIADFFGFGKKKSKSPPAKVDTSWHDAMVKRANSAFANQKPLVDKKLGTKSRAKKGSKRRTAKRK